ncbi:MAG: NAD(P)-dependent glycerol-3-phosphate dehydrogenase [Saprospiraceae bacterium]|nr:NAD(P)-dependent glycerol-3-phosphate dehydrogenase [Saprospiraceae bacterium]
MPDLEAISTVGVIGSGSFGLAVSNLLAHNVDVLLFSRRASLVEEVNLHHRHLDVKLSDRIQATSDIQEIAERCFLLFPIVPSASFRRMMRNLGPHLRPYHILIHGTKGFDVHGMEDKEETLQEISRQDVHTMSEVMRQESVAVRVGCLSGPNLASEILEGQPTATLIASQFKEVINLGKAVLNSRHFHVFGSHDLIGAELAGALKNIIAIGSGILAGKGLGKNIQAMLITRGLTEMVHFGDAMGADSSAFFGTAGIGDLVATATSSNSRNFTFGYRLGRGETREEIALTMPEVAEGVRTLQIARHLAKNAKLHLPIIEVLYRIAFENYDINRAIEFLMTFPYDVDVDFL